MPSSAEALITLKSNKTSREHTSGDPTMFSPSDATTKKNNPPENHAPRVSLRGDVVGGITTFLTMSYIVVVNPSILATPGTGMPFQGVLTATVIVASSMTLLMGLYARVPFAVAPGMGLNAFFAYSIVIGRGIPWPTALGLVFWSGVLFLALSLTPLRSLVAEAIPQHLRASSAVGVGCFIAFIGMKNIGLIEANPATFVQFKPPTLSTGLALLGLLSILVLMRKKSPLAFLIGILVTTVGGWFSGTVKPPSSAISWPDFSSVMGAFDPLRALNPSFAGLAFIIFFTDLFDSISTFSGVMMATQLGTEEEQREMLRKGLLVDACATLCSGIVGTSAGTAYIESAAGIEAGGRSGRASIVTAICFLPCLFLGPLVAVIPSYATGSVLIVVGALMFKEVRKLPLEGPLEDLIPAFFSLLLIPLTFSISQGILCGFLLHGLLYLMVGRFREVRPTMWVISFISAVFLALEFTGK